jgi:AraC-like DNA-binding protein
MPSSSVRTFTEPDEYAAELQQGPVELTITQRGSFTATLCTVELHQLAMQRQSETLARTSHVDSRGERAFIAFRTTAGPPVIRNGVELTTTSIARLRLGQSYYQHTSGSTAHAGISLPPEAMASVYASTIRGGPVPSDDDVLVTPASDAMTRLQRLSKAAGDLAVDAPGVIAHPEAARGLEQAIIAALIDCLGEARIEEDHAAVRQHAAIMRRFHGVIEQHVDRSLYVPELCREVGTSERTLRVCCQEHLGMSPKHYLLLRRMHLVRRALHASTSSGVTVTEIATRYGFWQFGWLAVKYKALFGESPSATLAGGA